MGEGHYAQDVVRWENLTLQTQMFAEITRVAYDNWLWPHMLDGAVGLGPFDSDKASSDSLNFLERLAARRKLKANLFSLLLPSDLNRHGQLLIGDIPWQYTNRPFSSIPVNEERSFKFGIWQSRISSITFEDKTTHWNNSYLGFNVHFSVAPVVLFPDDITATILKRAEEFGMPDRQIECNKRYALPNITLDIGTGRPLVLTGFDYTIESSRYGSICSVVVLPIKAYHKTVSTEWSEDVVVHLTWPTLARWLTVFDIDKREIRCKLSMSPISYITTNR